MNLRLTSVAPDLVEALMPQSATTLRLVAKAVADWTIERKGLVDTRVDAGIAALREGNLGPSAERSELHVLVEELDERAWNIQDRVDAGSASNEEYLAAFALARASSALWYALDNNALQAALESIYEAQAASGELGTLRDLVFSLLR